MVMNTVAFIMQYKNRKKSKVTYFYNWHLLSIELKYQPFIKEQFYILQRLMINLRVKFWIAETFL